MSVLLVVAAATCPPHIAHPADRDGEARMVVTVEPGNLPRLRVLDDPARLHGEYPMEVLKYKGGGSATVTFRLSRDGRATDPGWSFYTAEPFYQAALKILGQLRMEYIEGSWPAPINRFSANVAFSVPPCVPARPGGITDLQLTVCASLDPAADLTWKESPPDPPAAPTAVAPAKPNCDSPSTTIEIQDCLQAKLKKTEATLNATYQRAIRELSKPDIPGHIHRADAKQDLINAQRAWTTYRQKDCRALYALNVGGSIRGQLFLECQQRHTEQRIEEIKELLGL